LTEEQKKYAKVIEESGDLLLKMVNSMISICEIENGTLEIVKSDFSFAAVINEIESFLMPVAKKKNLTLKFDINYSIDEIYSDEDKVRTIIYNLTHNAIKFTPSGGNVTVKVSSFGRDFIRISVIDTGIGISEKEQQKLFRPFCQADSSLNRRYNGTGLGLSLAYELVEMLGGKMHLKSEPGKGSTFSFTVPICRY
jgi:signal transduction histidine kinase